MDSNVNPTVHQSIINFLGEQSLATNVCQRLIQYFVAGGLNDDDLESPVFAELGELRLHTDRQAELNYDCSHVRLRLFEVIAVLELKA